MSTWVQWMRYAGTEVANVNRTSAYIRNGLANDPRVQGYDDCDCEAIDEGPYVDPATDEAPWYTATRPESGDFLGLILNQIDMGPPWARKVTPRGGDGSSIGPLRLRGRTIGFRGLLYAASPQAMDYGRRWLSEVLAGGCDGCGVGDLCMLPACPEDEVETDRFFRTLKRAALIDGPTDISLTGVPCDLIQEVAFQFATEVGYLYEDPSVCMEDQVIVAGTHECCLLTTEEWIGDATAKITVVAGSPNRVEGLRIVATPTKDSICPVNPLDDAEALWRASSYDGSGTLLDDSGHGHGARLGSTGGGDANDPTFLDYEGVQYLFLSGLAGNSASAPDSAPLSIVGDIELIGKIAPDDWTPGAQGVVVGKWGAAGQRSYRLLLLAAGTLRLETSNNGTTVVTGTSTVATGFADGAEFWVRATLDVVNTTNRVYNFYTSTDGVTWTQLGATVTTAGTTSIFDSTALLEIGSANGADFLRGDFYRVKVVSGLGGTVVFDANFSSKAALTPPYASMVEQGTGAATVTINRSATGLKSAVVSKDAFLLGTDDYLEVPDHPDLDFGATDEFTIMLASRWYEGTFQTPFSKKLGHGAEDGYQFVRLVTNEIEFKGGDGVNGWNRATPATTPGEAFTVGGVRRRSPDEVEVYLDGVGDGGGADTTGDISNAVVLRIGGLSAGGSEVDMEFFAAAIWRRALSDAEMAIASSALLGQAPSEGTPCSDFTINNLIPGTKLVIDGTERTVEVREVTSDRIVGGLDVVTPAEGLFQFVDIGPCSSICVCSSVDAGGSVNADTRITVEQSNRET